MSKEKISSQELVEQIATKLSVSKRVAEEFLKSLFAEIEESLLKGESVKIKNLGTFKMQWNEPRKSVNVQTGEVFTIEGYNKVTFTPDADIKEAVNEPYSHLESIELDGQETPAFDVEKPILTTTEPLRNLNEQASEIKDILSQINALSLQQEELATKEKNLEDTAKLDIPDYDIVLIDEDEDDREENEVDDEEENDEDDASNESDAVEDVVEVVINETKEDVSENVTETTTNSINETVTDTEPYLQSIPEVSDTEEPEIDTTILETPKIESSELNDMLENEPAYTYTYSTSIAEETPVQELKPAKPIKKKRKGLRFLIGFLIVLLVVVGGIYIAYFSSSCLRCWIQYDLLSETNREKIDVYVHTFKGWFGLNKATLTTDSIAKESTPKITLPDTVNESTPSVEPAAPEIQTKAPADSLDEIFDAPRVYTEFLGEEEITDGLRLTNIAKHYYGKKEFWVYIYEANRDNIVHPDRITPGTIVKIPKVDAHLIDKKNPRCLQKAKELHDLYVGKQ